MRLIRLLPFLLLLVLTTLPGHRAHAVQTTLAGSAPAVRLVEPTPGHSQPGMPAAQAQASLGRILFVVASSRVHGTSALPASISFGELVHAWDVFHAAGYAVDFVSPEGGGVPILEDYIGDGMAPRLHDERIMAGLRNTAAPDRIDPARYRAVYYIGGSNAMYGVAENPGLQRIAQHVHEHHGGVVSAVCHGTAGIVNLTQVDGRSLIAGRRITGFPEQHEDQQAAYFGQFPFLIGQTVRARGGIFSAIDSQAPYIQVDGRLVTGQNYASAKPVAEAVVELLRTHQARPAAASATGK